MSVFHGLTRDAGELAAVRANLRNRQIYGPVSVDLWIEDNLPYGQEDRKIGGQEDRKIGG